MNMPLASRRVMRELRHTTADGMATNFRVTTVDGNLHHWHVTFEPPSALVLDIIFPPDYPKRPPKIRLVSPRIHNQALLDSSRNVWYD